MLKKTIIVILIIVVVILILGIISSQEESSVEQDKALETQNDEATPGEADNDSTKEPTELEVTEDELNKLKAEIDAMNYEDLNSL
jgi:FtsZ-interacting cell division protein ZipA